MIKKLIIVLFLFALVGVFDSVSAQMCSPGQILCEEPGCWNECVGGINNGNSCSNSGECPGGSCDLLCGVVSSQYNSCTYFSSQGSCLGSCDPGWNQTGNCGGVIFPTSTPGPTATIPPPPPGCSFGSCGSGCPSDQIYVSGSCNPPNTWFSGDGCYPWSGCSSSSPTPTPSPAPSTGTIIGRIWNDVNGNGVVGDDDDGNGLLDNGIQSSTNRCDAIPNFWETIDGLTVQYSGPVTNYVVNNTHCGVNAPYYAKNSIPVGNYTVSLLNLPANWALVSINTSGSPRCTDNGNGTANCTVSSGLDSHVWFGIQEISCSISLNNVALNVGQNIPRNLNQLEEKGAQIASVEFTSTNPSVATVTSPDNSGPSFTTTVGGVAVGSTTYSAVATMDNLGATQCTAPNATITVSNVPKWFNVIGGDIMAGGTNNSISTNIPAGRYLIEDGPGGTAGIPAAANGASNPTTSNSWEVQDTTIPGSASTYNYNYFINRLSSDTTISSVSQSTINSINQLVQGPSKNGYVYKQYTGSSDLVIDFPSTPISVGNNRAVFFVPPTKSVTIKDRVSVGPRGFFMIVGGGNIIIDPSVISLEGIYVADSNFVTQSNGVGADTQLVVRGMVIANNISLHRDLSDNTLPGEEIQFSPELLMKFPQDLSPKRIKWQEVAP